jgi:hypothetical protein
MPALQAELPGDERVATRCGDLAAPHRGSWAGHWAGDDRNAARAGGRFGQDEQPIVVRSPAESAMRAAESCYRETGRGGAGIHMLVTGIEHYEDFATGHGGDGRRLGIESASNFSLNQG